MNRLEHTGLVHTDPADPKQAVTDSAAAATAFATGVKTFNGAIGVDAKGKPVRTLLEDARKQGKATGLVTTSQVTDATPAAYAAHVEDRAQQSEIARQFLEVTKPDEGERARLHLRQLPRRPAQGEGSQAARAVRQRGAVRGPREQRGPDDQGRRGAGRDGQARGRLRAQASGHADRQHTGADTPITASGPGGERFDGVIDNTDVHDNIKRVMR